jgi:hypothetical protein
VAQKIGEIIKSESGEMDIMSEIMMMTKTRKEGALPPSARKYLMGFVRNF